MLIYSTTHSPRLEYALDVLFQHLLSLNYTFTTDFLFYKAHPGPKIHYGDRRLTDDVFFLAASKLLFERHLEPLEPDAMVLEGRPALFAVEPGSDWPFDLLAMCFYCLSRYEEYLEFEADRFGRFPAAESIALKHNFLERPILNEWAHLFGEALKKQWPNLHLPAHQFRFRLTFDIDMAWAYLHRPWWRILGGGIAQLLRGRWGGLAERIQVLRGKLQDPFYIFEDLKRLQNQYEPDTQYFWLLGDPGKYDLNADVQNPDFRALIQDIAAQYPVGIHPSFRSNSVPGLLEKEIERLTDLTGHAVTHSRQHFLMLSLPETYRRLLALGIRDDYSMGYADQVGYRAGIASPFPWYDLPKEQRTDLMIHPFAAMDVTLNFYLKLSPEQALERVQHMIQELRTYGGTFTLLWHNSSFATHIGWEGWSQTFEEILEYATREKD
ncbi:MAG: polysaccharide deacetylase family protein [Saprospiraceae bacterium]|nr:polysaccharide deacetylase family protein [Saprospiraceae bacterium]